MDILRYDVRHVIELKVLIYLQSGGTPETRNGLLEVQKAFREAGLDFPKQV
jgi:hypothetical protein